MSRTSNDESEYFPAIPPIPQLSELLLQPPSPIKTRETDQYGFYLDSEDASICPKLKKVQELEKEWISILDNWTIQSSRKKSRIKKLCRLGIPDSLRAKAVY